MKYTISQKQDVNQGLILTVEIPAADVDWHALYTLEADLPRFVVPFHYHQVDDVVELTFQPGDRRMLRYIGGDRKAEEYAELFINLLTPFQTCGDWFLMPLCFAVDFDWIFLEGTNNFASYLYFPVKEDCVTTEDIMELIRRVNNSVHVNDQELENKVLRTITDNNFRIADFMRIFQNVSSGQKTQPAEVVVVEDQGEKEENAGRKSGSGRRGLGGFLSDKSAKGEKPEKPAKTDKGAAVQRVDPDFADLDDDDDDDGLDIRISGANGKGDRNANKGEKGGLFGKLFGSSGEKQAKKNSRKESKRRNRDKYEEDLAQDDDEDAGYQVIGGSAVEVIPDKGHVGDGFYDGNSGTVVIEKGKSGYTGPRLEYAGRGNHEPVIEIRMGHKNMFKIGRFDTVLNKKQSDFEFPADTKEVSRRHAVIEKRNGSYYLVDIGSLAGTYVNDFQIGLNEQYKLNNGDQVSFGMAGAVYYFYSGEE